MNVTKVLTKDYENKRLFSRAENKPNQTQFQPKAALISLLLYSFIPFISPIISRAISATLSDGFGKQNQLFNDTFANMAKRKSYRDLLGLLKIGAHKIRVVIVDNIYLIYIRAAEPKLAGRSNHR